MKELVVGDAQSVLWVWYAYGKPHTYKNMYVRQYVKNADGTIRRAEGKRSDVRDGGGVSFHTVSETVVCLKEN